MIGWVSSAFGTQLHLPKEKTDIKLPKGKYYVSARVRTFSMFLGLTRFEGKLVRKDLWEFGKQCNTIIFYFWVHYIFGVDGELVTSLVVNICINVLVAT